MNENNLNLIFLYQIPRQSKIYCETSGGSTYVTFITLDGMYSYCKTEKDGVLHLSTQTPLVKFKDGYKIKE